jgi:hypothetical protein
MPVLPVALRDALSSAESVALGAACALDACLLPVDCANVWVQAAIIELLVWGFHPWVRACLSHHPGWWCAMVAAEAMTRSQPCYQVVRGAIPSSYHHHNYYHHHTIMVWRGRRELQAPWC